ncbi:MAG: fumarylacetoacetate hydrolase family protein [Myxococcota bacterium]
MKLGTLRDGTRDGRLVVVSKDGSRCLEPFDGPQTLQAALDDWTRCAPGLASVSRRLNEDQTQGEAVDLTRFGPPLPRAYEWIDGSAFLNHVRLVRKARGAEPPKTLQTDPLIYQGGSGVLLGPRDDIRLDDPAWGLDYEAEVCAILDDVPQATSAAEALDHVRLLTICNDVSLRALIPPELAKGFGFFNSKPATAFAPFAVTPDELGGAWKDGRIHLTMDSFLNGEQIGRTLAGPEMHFGFAELVAHIAKTRSFTAGTILGSGTVSNEDRSRGISCLAERRMIEIIDEGDASTAFMKVGDEIRIDMKGADGRSVFGTIEQTVVGR